MSAPPRGRKRKRSIHDTPADLIRMQLARRQLSELQIMEHVDALQSILESTKKPKLSCSSVTRSQLTEMGLKRKVFSLNDVALDARIAASSIDSKHIDALCMQLTRIHRSKSRRNEAGARMILDAVLLTIADISFEAKEKLPVAILPQMEIASGDGVLVKNTINQSEVWLTGNVDYGVCTYKHEAHRARIFESPLDNLMLYTGNRIMVAGPSTTLMVVEAKPDKEMFIDSLPEATSLAIALSEVTGDNTVRYCLSDGTKWVFLAYTRDAEGNRISYEGPLLTIMQPPVGEHFKKDVRCVVELLYHWLRADSDIENDPLFTV
ncbi:hypothetical protein EDD15DRAFT_2326637 [Pisolithus albus]|nr:hypothetical protein EDD15DRAFT_2326637 [Pisolithus albus]